ncbi:Dos2-interacting transcription regulator of RNA-Pol-II-domain-containing protein [Phycomyces nitens]|nr:Dos2-interacting transcription regulator of RNA-Pol-II-domain-containing protein [Phycomyces nitens]
MNATDQFDDNSVKDWVLSTRTEIDASFLAHVLLLTTKSSTGLSDLVNILADHWKDESHRGKSLELLGQVTTHSRSSLDYETVQVLMSFACERLNDTASVPSLLDLVDVLCSTPHFNGNCAVMLCQSAFLHIGQKKQQQGARHKLFLLLSKLLQTYTADLQRARVNFIGSFVALMDGEKDPRNLVIAFEIVRFLIEKFDISQHVEDLFDVLFCYFPISFNAPLNDPFSITTEDLKESLRRCLAATPYFANYATPLLTEKLLTTTASAKKDAMETIGLCAPAYGAHALLPHAKDIFDALVNEVYHASETSMEATALKTIHNVVATLGTGVSIANIRDPVEKTIDALLAQCVEKLNEPELKYAKAAALILRSAASASDPACTSVVHTTFPILQNMFNNAKSLGRQLAVLDIFIEILFASKSLYGSIEDIGFDRDFQTPLLSYKKPLLDIFITSLNTRSDEGRICRMSALKGIRQMVVMKQFLSAEEMEKLVLHLTQLIPDTDGEARSLVLSSLSVLAKLSLPALAKYTFPLLWRLLPGHQKPDDSNYHTTLEAVECLTINPTIFNTIVASSLLDKFDKSCRLSDQSREYVSALAKTMLNLFQTMAPKDPKTMQLGQHIFFPHIMSECIKSTLHYPGSWLLDTQLVDILSLFVAAVVKNSNSSHQTALTAIAFRLFVNGDLTAVNLQSTSDPTLRLFPLSVNAPVSTPSVDITLLFAAIIGNCRKDVNLPIPSHNDFIQGLVQASLNTMCTEKRLALAKTFASIVNKWGNESLMSCVNSLISTHLAPALESLDIKVKRAGLVLMTWLAKALVIQGHALGFQIIDAIAAQCQLPDVGREAANSFSTILQDDELILNKKSYANVSILYRQRVFNYLAPKLIETANISSTDSKINYFTALACLLVNVPDSVVASEAPKLITSINSSLLLSNSSLSLSMIKVTRVIIATSPEKIEYAIPPTIDGLLHSADPLQNLSISVRIESIQCLNDITAKYKPALLAPYAPSVIKRLSRSLDDKKRVVRKYAVDCRERWLSLT